MKKELLLLALCGFAACSSSGSKDEGNGGNTGEKAETYQNPVIAYSLPDPSVIRGDDGYFYLYATEDIRNLPIHRSKDLVNWEMVGTAFTDQTRPDFEPDGGLWAPDINKVGDRYVLYYSMSVWGGEWTCGIGCATADRPSGPFSDQGMMLRSNEINVQNSIDPFYIEEDNRKYLFWGSFRGIYGIELSDDGLSLKEGSRPVQIAGTAYEGTYIHKKEPGKKFMRGFRLVSAFVVFLGAGMEMSLLWDLSDVLMGVMALINIPVILILSGTAFKAIRDYEDQLKRGVNPVFKSADIELEQKTDFWN